MKNTSWSLREQGEFLKRAGELMERGYSLKDALLSLTFYLREEQKRQLADGINSLKGGYPFHYVLRQMKFHELLISFVYFGEQHGALSQAMFEGSRFILKRHEDRNKLQKLLLYPFVLILFTFVLFVLVERMMLPQFTAMFTSMNIKENIFLKMIQILSDALPIILLIFFIFLLLFILYYTMVFRKYDALRKSSLISRLPFAGSLYRLYKTYYFSIHFSHLLNSGLPIIDALQIFKKHEKNVFDRELGKKMHNELLEGTDLTAIVKRLPFFAEDLPFIMKHGQENGKLAEELYLYSNYTLEAFEGKIDKTLKIVQPFLYVMIGFIIVSMYLAILLPMFQLLEGF